jgi:arylsulfatase A-like enzyme
MVKERRPNVLLVVSDQHIANCMGCEGHPQAITPNMDRLAAGGARFAAAYTQNPICTPARVVLLSGQYCHNHGYYGLGGPAPTFLPTFIGRLRREGYRTGMVGKLHLPNDPDDWARADCDMFEECMRSKRGHQPRYYEYLESKGLSGKSDHERLPEFPGSQQHEGRPSLTSYEDSVEGWSVRHAIDFMKASGDAPFCVKVSFFRPHECYTPAKPFWDMYPDDLALPPTIDQDPSGRPPHFRRQVERYRTMQGLIEPKGFEHLARRVWHGYLGNITHCDHALGELMAYLDESGLSDNTIVIYMADHGAYSGTFGVPEKAPGICSESVCRVPMIWRVPGVTRGAVCRQLVESVDVAPTLASLCGAGALDWADGKDISALLAGEDKPVREQAVTENPWSKALRWKQWRYVHYQPEMFGGQDVGELYDLHADPNETRNLYHDAASQDAVRQCQRQLLDWLIKSTRHVTAWVPPFWPDQKLPIAGDGKETNVPGIPARFKTNMDYI